MTVEELNRCKEFITYFGAKIEPDKILVHDGHTSIVCNPDTEWKDFLGCSILSIAEVVADELSIKTEWREQ